MRLLCSIDNGGGSAYYAARTTTSEARRHWFVCLLLAFVLLAQLQLAPAYARGFPGKGSVQAWRQAVPLFNEGNKLVDDDATLGEAIRKYSGAVKMYPYDSDFWHGLARAYSRKGDLRAAEQAYRKAISLRPSDCEHWAGLGNVLCKNGQYDEGIRAFRQAISLNPPSARRAELLQGISKAERAKGKKTVVPTP